MNYNELGEAEWSIMMGSVSMKLPGREAWLVIRPADPTKDPAWWPNRIYDKLPRGTPVSLEQLNAAVPELASATFSDRIVEFFGTVEAISIAGELRCNVLEQVGGKPTTETIQQKHQELLTVARELQEALRQLA
jgi:hypothetical protein